MTTFGKSIVVKGEVRTSEDLTIEGRIEGYILGEHCAVLFAPGAEVTGETLARDITIHGHVSGHLVATDVVDVRADAVVAAQVIARRFILEEGSHFTGRVEPQHLEAALRVSKFNRQKRDAT